MLSSSGSEKVPGLFFLWPNGESVDAAWKINPVPFPCREEAEAHEREVMAEFAADLYKGDPVLRSGGDSELFTRDVLELDSQDDFHAMVRRERLAEAALLLKTNKWLDDCAQAVRSSKSEGLSWVEYQPLIIQRTV